MNLRPKITLSLLLTIVLGTASLAEVVDIPDPNLERVIRDALDVPRGTSLLKEDMLKLTHLPWSDENIEDLTGLEHATNVVFAVLGGNPITDLAPIGSLPRLETLHIAGIRTNNLDALANLAALKDLFAIHCAIEDISALAGLTNLVALDLAANRIVDISALANLTALEKLHIERNRIVDVSPLAGLTKLKELHIFHNRIVDFSAILHLSIIDLWRDEECVLPGMPIHDRIANRSLPSVFQPWSNGISSQEGTWWDDSIPFNDRVAAHDLWWHGPGANFQIRLELTPQGYQIIGDMPREIAYRDELLSKNPSMLFLADLRQHYARIVRFGEDWFGWLRDENGNIVPVDQLDPHTQYLIDFRRPAVQDDIVQRAIAVARCGLFDGIMFDAWGADDSASLEGRYSILRRIRESVPNDFLILFNTNHFYIPDLVPYINGAFMETFPRVGENGYTRDRIIEIETNLIRYESNVREPKINCLRGLGIGAEPPDNPNNRRWMRLFTTMSLTCSDGYVLYTLGDIGGQRQFQKHIWHSFWGADLGQPTSPATQLYQDIEGMYIREFTNGWAVYNRSGAAQVITLPEEVQGVASSHVGTEHTLPNLDGDMYLRVKPPNPADVNGDGVVNILDLTIIAQAFGTDSLEGDVNGDGVVNVFDLVFVAGEIQ